MLVYDSLNYTALFWFRVPGLNISNDLNIFKIYNLFNQTSCWYSLNALFFNFYFYAKIHQSIFSSVTFLSQQMFFFFVVFVEVLRTITILTYTCITDVILWCISLCISSDILIRSLLLKCQSLAGRFPSLLQHRRSVRRPYLGTHYYFRGVYACYCYI